MDIVGTLVGGEEPQALGQTLLELRSGEVHAQIQIDHLLAGVVGISEALIGLGLLLTVGEVHNDVHARLLQRRIHIGVAAQLRVDGGGATVQHILTHAGGGDVAEVAELGIGQVGIIGTVIGALQVVHDVLGHVAALLRHLEGDLHGIGHTLPSGPVPRLILIGVLLGQLIGLSKVAHVDGHGDVAGRLTVGVLLHDDGGLAGIHIGIGRHHRQGQGLIQELDRHQIAPGKAQLAHEVLGLAVGVDVAVLGHPDVGVQTADGDLAVIRLLRRDDGHAALRLAVPGLGDGAAQLIGDVVHDHGIQRQTALDLAAGSGEGVVDVAAGGQEVVGDDSVGGILIKGLAVDALDGHTVDALGTIVGGAGIGGVVLVVILGAVHRQLHAGGLGEAAQRRGSAEGSSLQRLQQLGAGDIHHRQRIAEGQNGEHVLLGDVAGLDGGTDAAAVGDGHSVLHVDAGHPGLNGPHHSVGNKVAHVGLLGAVAGLLVAVELHLGLGEHLAVLGIHLTDDPVGDGLDGGILLGVGAQIDETVALHALGGVINDESAHIRKTRTGRLDHAVVLVGGHHGVGVAVDDDVHTGDVLHEIDGAVGFGGRIYAQMSQSDDDIGVALLTGDLDHGVGGVIQLLAGQEGQALHQSGVGLGLSLRSGHTHHGEVKEGVVVSVRNGSGSAGSEDGITLVVHQIDAGHQEVGGAVAEVCLQLGEAVVKLVVAQRHGVVAHSIHQLHSGSALAEADVGRALAEVTGIQQHHSAGAPVVALVFQCRNLGVFVNSAMYVVGVQNDRLALQRSRQLIPSRRFLFCPGGRHQQSQCHHQGQEQC